MKKKPYLSRHRGICILSGVCLLVPVLINCLRAQGSPTPACVSAALLCGCAVLLLLPLADERIDVSLRFALAIVAVCAAGSLLDAAERIWLLGVLALFGGYLLYCSAARYDQLWPLFRQFAVWYSVTNHARYTYALALCLLAAALPKEEAPLVVRWLCPAAAAALYGVLLARVHTGRTFFLRAKKELEIKQMMKGSLRSVPVRPARKSADVARMTRLYERVVEHMESKHPFLDAGYSLDDLAGTMFSNRAYLSRTINILSGRNFRQFINYYRVQYCVELIRQDPTLKLIKVAMMGGFHSTVSFNMAFKLNMGENPTEFQERVRLERFKD